MSKNITDKINLKTVLVNNNKIQVSWNVIDDVKYIAIATSFHGPSYKNQETTINGKIMKKYTGTKSYATFDNLEPGVIYRIKILIDKDGIKKYKNTENKIINIDDPSITPNIGLLSSILVTTTKTNAISPIMTSETQTKHTNKNMKIKQFTVTSNNGKTQKFTVTEKVGGKRQLENKMRLKYRMGVRRTLKKSRTAKKRQNGGVAPVSYSIPFGQRQPTEAIMERATTAGGKRKGSYRKRRGTRRNKRN